MNPHRPPEPPACKTMKCLSYPVCLHKKSIECEILTLYYRVWFAMHLGYTASHIWARINEVLPKLYTIQDTVIEKEAYRAIRHPLLEMGSI